MGQAPPFNTETVSAVNFDRMMADVGPFESTPHVAVAVSGGGDSMALCLLADVWARQRGGRMSALTVDHGLRPESPDEAEQVGRWLRSRSIDHHILTWRGRKPVSGLQAAARQARYDLMGSWARQAGVLHLLIAHNMEDQAETFLLRLERGSGIVGLSSMAAVVETPSVRLLRPLLCVSGSRLRGTLGAMGQEWIEDPSNRDTAFTRTKVRAAVAALAAEGLKPERMAMTAHGLGHLRVTLEGAVSTLLAHCCVINPAGYAHIDAAILAAAPEEASLRALARILLCIGGKSYAPGLKKLKRLHQRIATGTFNAAGTLGGCRILPPNGKGPGKDRILVCREGRGAPPPFAVEFSGDGEASLSRLGRNGWSEIAAQCPQLRSLPIPHAARLSLPALRDDRGVVAAPHLKYRRNTNDSCDIGIKRIAFCPPNSISGAGFFLV